MMIGNISGSTNGIQMQPTGANDQVSRDIQNQISRAQQKLKDIADDEKMSPDEKSKKRQEIQKEITALENELRQHQMDLRREAASQKNGGNESRHNDKGNDGMSKASMESMISADNNLKQVDSLGSLKTGMKGQAGVLESEIKLDKARGQSTEKKEEELKGIEKRISSISSMQTEKLSEANKKTKDDPNEEEMSEETLEEISEETEELVAMDAIDGNPDAPEEYVLPEDYIGVDYRV